jgi:molecular chaperone DnaK (HSP70)
MRKLLTANKESDLHCEALLEDHDLHKPFTREQFEELIEPWIGEFRACLEESIAKSGKLEINKLRQARVAGLTLMVSSLTITWLVAFCQEPLLRVSSWAS